MARPGPNSPSIPLFDLPLSSDAATAVDRELAKCLATAAHSYGFLYIRHPLFSFHNVSRMFELASAFFSLPQAVKGQHSRGSDNHGFVACNHEGLNPQAQPEGDPKEAFNFGEFSRDACAQQPLPDVFRAKEHELAEFQRRCRQVCLQLLELMAEGLQIEPSALRSEARSGVNRWLSSRHDPARGSSGTIFRFLHYPPFNLNPGSGTTIRAGAHSDYGSLTLLFRQIGDSGLEIQPPRAAGHSVMPSLERGSGRDDDGGWLPVPVLPPRTESDAIPPILVNIGDLLSYWTGGWLRSTVHRVVSPPDDADVVARDRFSIAYFCHPVDDTVLEPVPSEVVRAHIRSMQSSREGETSRPYLTARQHLQDRLRETYNDSRREHGAVN